MNGLKFILLFIVGFLITVSAQTKLGFVDTQKLTEELSEAKALRKKADFIEQEFKNKKQKLVDKYKELGDRYRTSRLILTETKRMELERQISETEQSLQNFDRQNSATFAKRVQDLMDPFQNKVRSAIENVRKTKKLDVVLDKQMLLAVREGLDITNDVKQYLEKKRKNK